jgi:hypothetical protein
MNSCERFPRILDKYSHFAWILGAWPALNTASHVHAIWPHDADGLRAVQAAYDAGYTLFDLNLQLISGMRAIKSYRAEERELANTTAKAKTYLDGLLEVSRVQSVAFQPNYFVQRFFGGFIPWQYRDIKLQRATDTNWMNAYRRYGDRDLFMALQCRRSQAAVSGNRSCCSLSAGAVGAYLFQSCH